MREELLQERKKAIYGLICDELYVPMKAKEIAASVRDELKEQGVPFGNVAIGCPFSAAPPLLCGQPCRRRPALLRGALDAQRCPCAHPPGARTRRKGGVPGVSGRIGLLYKKESGLHLRAAFCMVQGHTLSQSSSVQSVRNWSLTCRRAGSSDLLAASAMPMTRKPASWAVRAA